MNKYTENLCRQALIAGQKTYKDLDLKCTSEGNFNIYGERKNRELLDTKKKVENIKIATRRERNYLDDARTWLKVKCKVLYGVSLTAADVVSLTGSPHDEQKM